VPSGVTPTVSAGEVSIKGPKGTLTCPVPPGISVTWNQGDRELVVDRDSDIKKLRALHGLTRALINNNVLGVTEGYKKVLEIVGVGFNARVQGNKLLLTVGFANTVERVIPPGVTVETPQPTRIEVTGADKQVVGHFARNVRDVNPCEPYKGKGIKFEDEVVRRKPGKAFAGGGAP
jgi:large subunit ribosomal protein L6